MVNCRIEASIDSWLEYSFPTPVKCQVAGGIKRYRGQTQKWFLLRFSGTDAEINLSCHGEGGVRGACRELNLPLSVAARLRCSHPSRRGLSC